MGRIRSQRRANDLFRLFARWADTQTDTGEIESWTVLGSRAEKFLRRYIIEKPSLHETVVTESNDNRSIQVTRMDDDALAAFTEQKPRIFGIAYRTLGSVADAEDMVQETFLRWQNGERAGIKSAEAWLVRGASPPASHASPDLFSAPRSLSRNT